MQKYDKEKKIKILKTYLIVMLISMSISVFNLILGFITKQKIVSKPSINFMGILAIFLFCFSIYCLIKFIKLKLNKVTLILPIWVIAEISAVFISALVMGVRYLSAGGIPPVIEIPKIISILNLIHDTLQLSFTSYLLYIFKK